MEVISAWELYLWTRLDSMIGLCWGVFWVALITLYGHVAFGGFCAGWIKTHLTKFCVAAAAISVVALIACVFAVMLPSKRDMAMIYVIPKLANSQTIQTEANEIYTIAKEALKEMLPSKEVDNPQ